VPTLMISAQAAIKPENIEVNFNRSIVLTSAVIYKMSLNLAYQPLGSQVFDVDILNQLSER